MRADQLEDILFRIENRMSNWRDVANLRAYIVELEAGNASLRAEVDAHDRALQQRDMELAAIQSHGGGRWLITTPTGNVDLIVNGVPIPLHNGEAA